MASLKAFKSPVGKVHLYGAYLIMLIILLHIAAVVRAEVKEEESLMSSMGSGKKVLRENPQAE